jgi:hypothetical protein
MCDTPTCEYCNEAETNKHQLYDCNSALAGWQSCNEKMEGLGFSDCKVNNDVDILLTNIYICGSPETHADISSDTKHFSCQKMFCSNHFGLRDCTIFFVRIMSIKDWLRH